MESRANRYIVEKKTPNNLRTEHRPAKTEAVRFNWLHETATASQRLVLMAEHLLYRCGQFVRMEQEKADLPNLQVR
jgi:hypothetical protein